MEMPRQKAKRPDDKRLSANRPKRTPVKPKSRWQQLIDGDITVDDLDDEEIAMQRCKDKNGRFTGRPPKDLPRELAGSMKVAFARRVQEQLDGTVDIAIQTLVEVAANKAQAGVARVNAANSLLERVVGKVPDKVVQDVIVRKFEEDISGIFVDVVDEVAAKRQEKTG
jgi:hypothetical protein